MEIIQFVSETKALTNRLAASDRGQAELSAFDLPFSGCLQWYIPGTDIPNQAAGIASTGLWHTFNIVALLFILGDQVPVSTLMNYWTDWAGPFGNNNGVWYSGALQILIGSGILGTPIRILGDQATADIRYGAGWALVGTGGINILLAIWYGTSIRIKRNQFTPSSGANKIQVAKNAYKDFVTVLDTTYALHIATGPMHQLMEELGDKLGDL